MARPYLTGFITKPKAGSDAQTLDLLRKSQLSQTQTGEWSNVTDLDAYIAKLQKLPQTAKVQEEILDMQNKRLQVANKQSDLLASKGIYEQMVQDATTNAVKNNFNNPQQLLGALAAINADAADNYDQHVTNKIFQQYGSTSSIPDDILKYRTDLNDKAKTYADMFNAYNFVDQKTGEAGALDNKAYAVLMTTNPATGKVLNVDFVRSDKVPDGFMRTDVNFGMGEGAKKLPTYLKSYDIGVTEQGTKIQGARLGDFSFAGTTEAVKKGDDESIGKNILKIQKQSDNIFTRLARIFLPVSAEYKYLGRSAERDYEQAKSKGITTSNFSFDSTNIPDNSLVQIGSKLYYQATDGGLQEISGKDATERQSNLDNYLNGIKQTPVGRFFADKNYLLNSDGSSRIKGTIDQNVFTPAATTTTPKTISYAPEITQAQALKQEMGSSFFASKNKLTAPKTAKESSGGKSFVGDIIEKGKSFFRNKFMA